MKNVQAVGIVLAAKGLGLIEQMHCNCLRPASKLAGTGVKPVTPEQIDDAPASSQIGSARTDWSLSVLRWSEPVALLELAREVRLRGEAAAQCDVADGPG
jgi:hypothetical protein